MGGDRLVIEIDGVRHSFDTSDVESVVESVRLPFLPGGAGFITGIISLRGEPVTVVDLRKVLSGKGKNEEGPRRIVVVRRKNRILGFDVGLASISFLWKEVEGAGETRPEREKEGVENPVRAIDWGRIFDETIDKLSTDATKA